MKVIQKLFALGYMLIVALFFVCAAALIVLAGTELWGAVQLDADLKVRARFDLILEAIGLLTIAVASMELGQTVLDEEVQRSASISAPTRVRRFLSRFLIVVVVSLAIECLIAVFQFAHGQPELLPHAASVGVAAAVMLAAWGAFVRMNVDAEKLEPQQMQAAKAEDDSVET